MNFFFTKQKKIINLVIVIIAIGFDLGISQQLGYSKLYNIINEENLLIKENLMKGFDQQNALMKLGNYKVGKTYKIKGRKYKPKTNFSYNEVGLASWYGKKFHGRKTANGEIFDMNGISAAHKTLQLPCVVKVTNLQNGKALMVRVNDRGPFHKDNRIIDLSRSAAEKLGFKEQGVTKVRVEVMTEKSIKLAAYCQKKKFEKN